MAPPKKKCSRSDEINYNPVGEKLPQTRPATHYEILKCFNFHKSQLSESTSDYKILKDFVVPDICHIWNKVHADLTLKDELSMISQLKGFITNVNSAGRNRYPTNKLPNLKLKFKQVFNATTCKCNLPNVDCR